MRQLHEPGELLMIEGRVRPDDTDRRPETRGGATDIVPDHVVHLEETFSLLTARPPNRPILEQVVDVADTVRHDDGSDRPGPHLRGTAPEPAFRPAFRSEERPDRCARPSSDVSFEDWFRRGVQACRVAEVRIIEAFRVRESEVVDVRPHDRGHLAATRRRGELPRQPESSDAGRRVEAVDVPAGEEQGVALDEGLPQVRGRGVVGPGPPAPRIGEGHGRRAEQHDRATGPSAQILGMADPDAPDRRERAVRRDDSILRERETARGEFNGCAGASTTMESAPAIRPLNVDGSGMTARNAPRTAIWGDPSLTMWRGFSRPRASNAWMACTSSGRMSCLYSTQPTGRRSCRGKVKTSSCRKR